MTWRRLVPRQQRGTAMTVPVNERAALYPSGLFIDAWLSRAVTRGSLSEDWTVFSRCGGFRGGRGGGRGGW